MKQKNVLKRTTLTFANVLEVSNLKWVSHYKQQSFYVIFLRSLLQRQQQLEYN